MIQISGIRYLPSTWQIQRGRREQSSSLSCQLVLTNEPAPRMGGLISLIWNDQVLFGGVVQQAGFQQPREYQIQAVGMEKFLLRKQIRSLSGYDLVADGRITPAAASAIVTAAGAEKDLMVSIRQQTVPDPQPILLQGVTGAQALSILCDMFGYDWWVEPLLPVDQENIDTTQPIGQVILQSPDWPSNMTSINLRNICHNDIQRVQSRLQARSITRVTVARHVDDLNRDVHTPMVTVRRVQIPAGSEQREFPLLPATDHVAAAIET